MNLRDMLTKEELCNVYECLRLVTSKKVFEDWEFETLFGVNRDSYFQILESWPNVNMHDANTESMVINAMNHVLGYPWGDEGEWRVHFSATPDDIMRTLEKLLRQGH